MSISRLNKVLIYGCSSQYIEAQGDKRVYLLIISPEGPPSPGWKFYRPFAARLEPVNGRMLSRCRPWFGLKTQGNKRRMKRPSRMVITVFISLQEAD